tara:strand:- start:373 stop:1143 length:771 start_codon:yes stop_codon:yes gene_type:complete
MKKNIAKLVNFLDRFLHAKFDFLNVGKAGQFNKNYAWIYKYLIEDKNQLSNKTFIEVGSRDALDSLDILSEFNFSQCYIFEPSHVGIKETIKNLQQNINFSKKIIFFPFALGNSNSINNFYEPTFIPKGHITPNIGSSTIFGQEHENNRNYKIPIFELDSLNINFENNYLIIMDCEGSEYSVLLGSKLALKSSAYVCLETSYITEKGNCLDIKKFLESENYKLVDCDWPNTGQYSLPKKEEVQDSQFCLLFKNNAW